MGKKDKLLMYRLAAQGLGPTASGRVYSALGLAHGNKLVVECGYYDFAALLEKVAEFLEDCTIGEYQNAYDRLNFPWAVMSLSEILTDHPHYRTVPRTEIKSLNVKGHDYVTVKKNLARLLTKYSILPEKELRGRLAAAEYQFQVITTGRGAYSFGRYKNDDFEIAPGTTYYFDNPFEVLTHMLHDYLDDYLLLLGDSEIAQAFAPSANKHPGYKPGRIKKFYPQLADEVCHHKWLLPQAYQALTATKNRAAAA